MNSFIKYIPESLNDHKAFVELLLSIIDTKLQFVKHRTNTVIADYSEIHLDEQVGEYYPSNIYQSNFKDGELMIDMIEKYSKTTNLLLLLRTKLGEHNVSLVYDLLNNNNYLNYDHKTLEKLLDKAIF